MASDNVAAGDGPVNGAQLCKRNDVGAAGRTSGRSRDFVASSAESLPGEQTSQTGHNTAHAPANCSRCCHHSSFAIAGKNQMLPRLFLLLFRLPGLVPLSGMLVIPHL